ncbi:MAG: pyridoxamine 5'-phosphate oxidase family protein [Acidimicrobiia bacterium]|nr:pyridoxamine 5'-phosphate oxidase family protein [Acidimicrobiia bacterium]
MISTRRLEILDEEACLTLLATEDIGRVAVMRRRSAPLVVPVTYVLDDQVIVFRAGFGALYPAVLAHPVSFQVDRSDTPSRTGWSVLVEGSVSELRQREVARALPEPWMPGERPYLLGLLISEVSGRRIAAG